MLEGHRIDVSSHFHHVHGILLTERMSLVGCDRQHNDVRRRKFLEAASAVTHIFLHYASFSTYDNQARITVFLFFSTVKKRVGGRFSR